MKKSVIVIMLCLIGKCVIGQENVGEYSCEYLGKRYSVEYDGSFKIQIEGESSSRKVYFSFLGKRPNDVEEFRSSLVLVREKYAEWSKVAKDNGIVKYSKGIDVVFPEGLILWEYGDEIWGEVGKPNPKFLVIDGKCLCVLFSGEKISAIRNRYITTKVYWVFSSPEEIDKLYNLLSKEAIEKYEEKMKKTEVLFH